MDVYAEMEGEKDKARRALELLEKFDPVRRPYWGYKRGVLGLGEVGA